jgi:hypothetical protein
MKLLGLGIVLVLGASIVTGASTATVALSARPAEPLALFAWVPTGGYPDAFPFGQCTWWVAFNRQVTWGGDARDWARNAQAQGILTSPLPSVGAIAVYRPGGAYSALGHVAVVVGMTATTYTVSEMNAPNWGRVDARTIPWPDPAVEAFIPISSSELAGAAHRSPGSR